jgi:Tol biopolymer transport system component
MTISGAGRAAALLILAAALQSCGASADSPSFKAKTFTLVAPEANATGVPLQPEFQWTGSSNAQNYRLQVATTDTFASLVVDAQGLTALSTTPPTPLNPATTYWWRVIANVGATQTVAAGSPASFTTLVPLQLRRVAFQSDGTTLVAGDTNGRTDLFVRDIVDGTTVRANVSAAGDQVLFGDGALGSMTPDGKYLTFQCGGNELIPGSTGFPVYVRDLDAGTLERCPEIPGKVAGGSPTISADGRFVAFTAFDFVASDIYVWDRQTGTTVNISVTPGGSASTSGNCLNPAFSGNGRFVAFQSFKNDLVAADTNGTTDVFVRDLQYNVTERVSVSSAAVQGNNGSSVPAISADGRFVAFASVANNLVPGDTNNTTDVFVRDRTAGTTEMVSVSSTGEIGHPSASVEARPPSISADGRYVAFEHASDNLVAGDTNGTFDLFVRDRQLGTTRRVSVSSGGVEGNGPSYYASIFPYGGFVAFVSEASNLVAGDTNGVADIFLHNLATGETTRLSVATDGTESDGWSLVPSASSP